MPPPPRDAPTPGGKPGVAPPPPAALQLLQGQVYRAELTVTNTGKLPIEEATIAVGRVGGGKGAPRVIITVRRWDLGGRGPAVVGV